MEWESVRVLLESPTCSWVARLKRKREPSRFVILVGRVG